MFKFWESMNKTAGKFLTCFNMEINPPISLMHVLISIEEPKFAIYEIMWTCCDCCFFISHVTWEMLCPKKYSILMNIDRHFRKRKLYRIIVFFHFIFCESTFSHEKYTYTLILGKIKEEINLDLHELNLNCMKLIVFLLEY